MSKDEANASPKDAALRLALEYVELVPDDRYSAEHIDQDALITAIKAALEAKDEPVVWNGGVPAMLPKQKEGETFIVSYEPKLEAKDEPVALAWAEGYRMGVADERTSEANIGIAGFNAKVEPARENPYITTPPQRKPLTYEEMKTVVEQELVNYWDGEYIDTTGARDCLTNFARAIEAAHGIKGEA